MLAGPAPDPVRMAATVALGRCGWADGARAVLAVANDPAAPDAVREAGVLALGQREGSGRSSPG